MQKAQDTTTFSHFPGIDRVRDFTDQPPEFEAFCQVMADGVIAFDNTGTSTFVNEAGARIFGYSTSSDMKRDFDYFKDSYVVYELNGTELAHEQWPVSRAIRGEILNNLELRVRRLDVELEWIINFSGGPVVNTQGVQTSAIIICRDITANKQSEELLDAQKHSLEMVLSNAPLEEVLSFLTGVVEKQSRGQVIASVLLLDHEGYLRHGAAPGLPDSYNAAIDGLKAQENLGTCSRAAATGDVVITPDIAAARQWKNIKHLPLALGLKAAWSQPIIARDGHVLGTFGTYFHECREPTAQERRIVEMLARMAAIAIEHDQDEKVIRNNERQNRLLVTLDDTIRPLTDPDVITLTAARLLGEHLGVNRCAYADVEEDEDTFNLTGNYTNGVPTIVGRYTFRQFGMECLALMRSNKPYIVQDSETDPRCADIIESYRMTAIRSVICVPLHKAGRFAGAMAVHCMKPRQWLDHEVELVEAVAARCWESIERARVTRTLRESEKQFRDATNSINQMIWVTRPDGYHEYYNKRWYEYTGVPAGSTDGEDWNGMFHKDDQEKAWSRWRHSLATGEPYEIEYRLRRADGVYRWVLGRAECIRNEKGEIIKWYGTCTDIQDLVDARQKAEEANIAKSEFLANMSHEIRTPMNAVIGLSNILAMSTPLTDKQKEFIKTLQLSADSLLELINDLLDIAKIEARTIELEETSFSLTRVMQEVISIMSVRSKEKGLEFTFQGECIEDRVFIGDPTRLRQIIMNLCSNAIKFTESGGVHIAVTCETSSTPNIESVKIAVRDTGIGIASDKLGNIFEKFVQGDTSINRKYGGTGLGLAITKKLTEIMNGTICVESELGKGSTFTVQLNLPVGEAPIENRSKIPQSAPRQIPSKYKVLLVEDYQPNILVATAFLDKFGYSYDIVNNGSEAVEQAKNGKYVAIIMDIQMHGMNGLEATQLIRSEEAKAAKRQTPIIGMTAHAMAGDRERCLAAGMNDYIAKPFNPEELEAMLKKYSREQ